MVMLHVKCGSEEFLYECSTADTVDSVSDRVASLHNLRLRLRRCMAEGEELAKHGPAKPYDKQEVDEELVGEGYTIFQEGRQERGPHYCADPTGKRTGEAGDPRACETLRKTLEEAAEWADNKQVLAKVTMTAKLLQDEMDKCRGAVMMAYPMGLPEWDPVRLILEDDEELGGTQASLEHIDPDKGQLWVFGKAMERASQSKKLLGDWIGKNEKTKVVVRLQKKGGQAPQREAPIDKDTQASMMAWYNKKQKEQESLAENDEDDYTNSDWSSAGALKASLTGVGSGIKFR